MKREVIENLNEKDFVASLIMSDKCCQILLPYVKVSYFDCDYSRVIVNWVEDHYRKFKVSPKKDITSIYRLRCDEIADEALKDLVYNYLKNIAESDININNEDYLVDKGRDFIDYKALAEYTEQLNDCLATRSMDKARQIQQNYKKISVTETNEVSLLSEDSIQIIQDALDKEEEVLFELPENMSKVFGRIHRNDFIAILSPPKRGKTWIMQYLSQLAMKQGLNVTFISMEMTREEVIQRMWKSLNGVKSGLVHEGKYETCRFYEDPVEKGKYRHEKYDIEVKPENIAEIESVSDSQKKIRTATQYKGDIRIIAYPRFSASVKDICNRVEELANEGYVTDVLVIDYADITTPIGGGSELRNQLDEIWKYLGGFATKFHCAVITASQTNRSGMSSNAVGAEMIGENFKKIAHITSMVALEQTRKMKDEHIMRIRNLAIRNGEVEETCVFPQCLGLAQFVFGKPILGRDFTFADDSGDDEDE